jgi:hypothetical protein
MSQHDAQDDRPGLRIGVLSSLTVIALAAMMLVRPRDGTETDSMWLAWRLGELAGVLFAGMLLAMISWGACGRSNAAANLTFSCIVIAAMFWQGNSFLNPPAAARDTSVVDQMLAERGLLSGR